MQGYPCVQVCVPQPFAELDSFTALTTPVVRSFTLCASITHVSLIFSKPFLKEKSSDENKYAAAVIKTFVLLGKIMSKCPLSVCCEIASTVAAFYTDRSEEEYQALPEGM